MKHMTITPEGNAFKVLTLISQVEIGPKAQAALGIKKAFKTSGLTQAEAVRAAQAIDEALEKQANQKRR